MSLNLDEISVKEDIQKVQRNLSQGMLSGRLDQRQVDQLVSLEKGCQLHKCH